MDRAARIKQLLLDFVAIRTDTGTEWERNNRRFYEKWWQEVPYFVEHPDQCGCYRLPDDPLKREVCWSLLLGTDKETVVLIHHTDTVNTEDYGVFAEVAYHPESLQASYQSARSALPSEAWDDLISGDWLFGRGVSDMKSGAAMQCALLEEYASDPDFKSSVLLLGVPDEENMSAGMRGAIPLLAQLEEQYGLHYRLLVNSEPHEREQEEQAVIFDGSVGKLMPIVLARGQLSHVSEVYQGLNATQLLAAVVHASEMDPWFVEAKQETVVPAATWLSMRDRKRTYDVSLPLLAGGYLSVLHLMHTPREIVAHLKQVCQTAFTAVLSENAQRYQAYADRAHPAMPALTAAPLVLTYQELYQKVSADPEALDQLAATKQGLIQQVNAGKIAFDEANFRLLEETLTLWPNKVPVIVLGLMAPYYPAVSNADLADSQWVNAALADLNQAVRQQHQETLAIKHYFTGISDMSYAMFVADQRVIADVTANMLFFGDSYTIPFQTIQRLSMPVLNIGAWGKDLHRYTERVNLEDVCHQAPWRLDWMIRRALS